MKYAYELDDKVIADTLKKNLCLDDISLVENENEDLVATLFKNDISIVRQINFFRKDNNIVIDPYTIEEICENMQKELDIAFENYNIKNNVDSMKKAVRDNLNNFEDTGMSEEEIHNLSNEDMENLGIND